jgi:hypothetical protein
LDGREQTTAVLTSESPLEHRAEAEARNPNKHKRTENAMIIEYDKERAAALVREAQEITRDLKVEAEGLKQQIARVLHGEDDSQKVADVSNMRAKSGWAFWR